MTRISLSTNPPIRRFAALDSWRGLCALLVASFHLHMGSHFSGTAFSHGSFLLVDFFFVLSGFVMTQAYSTRLHSPREFGSFVIRRFGRLWPLHAAVLAAYVLVGVVKLLAIHYGGVQLRTPPFTGEESWPSFAANVLLVQAVGLFDQVTWNGPSWSIGAEFWAYIVFGGVLLRARGRLALVSALIALAAAATLVVNSDSLMDTTFRAGTVRGLYGFFTGVVTHRLFQRVLAGRDVSVIMATIWESLAVVGVGVFVAATYADARSYGAPLVFALVVGAFACDGGKISALLHHRGFQALGLWSYSVYMIHAFLITQLSIGVKLANRLASHAPALDHALTLLRQPYGRDAVTIAILAGVVGVAALTYRWIERPGQAYFQRLAATYAGPRSDARNQTFRPHR